jgi:coenzyme F420 hydrogenase subunit delta
MTEVIDYLPEYCRRSTLILGCGNILLGDDGFGPEVIAYLKTNYPIPEDVMLMDAGTGVGEILLDVALSDKRPERVIFIDAMENGQPAGTISTLHLEDIGRRQTRTLSAHQVPTSTLLKELKELGKVEVTVLTVEPGQIPQDIQPGLSPIVREAVPRACEFIVKRFLCSHENSMAQELLDQAIANARR